METYRGWRADMIAIFAPKEKRPGPAIAIPVNLRLSFGRAWSEVRNKKRVIG